MRRLSLGILFAVFLVGLAAAAQTPKTAAEYIDRGADRLRIGEIDDAISDFSKAIELDNSALKGPKSDEIKSRLGRAHFNRGLAWYTKTYLDKALIDFDKALSLDPGNANAFMMRGLVRCAEGADEDADQDFRKSVALNSSNKASIEKICSPWILDSLYCLDSDTRHHAKSRRARQTQCDSRLQTNRFSRREHHFGFAKSRQF